MNTTHGISVPASSISEKITVDVRVTGLGAFRLRWWVARWLLVAAAKVAGCGIEFDVRS